MIAGLTFGRIGLHAKKKSGISTDSHPSNSVDTQSWNTITGNCKSRDFQGKPPLKKNLKLAEGHPVNKAQDTPDGLPGVTEKPTLYAWISDRSMSQRQLWADALLKAQRIGIRAISILLNYLGLIPCLKNIPLSQ